MAPKHILTNYACAVIASLCMAIFGYDGTLFASVQVMPSWVDHFNDPKPALVGAVNTSYSVAAVVFGFFVSPIISDRLGRKTSIGTGAGLVIVAAFVMTFAPNMATFIAGRTIAGAGQGVAMPAGTIFIEELVYAKTRGRLLSIWQISYGIGNKIATYTALGCQLSDGLGSWQWRTVTFLQLAIPCILIPCLFFVPETPRWHIMHGNFEKAREALSHVRLPQEVDEELLAIKGAIAYEQENTAGSYKQLIINKSYRNRLMLAIVMNIGQQFTGIGSLSNYSGLIFNQVFPDPDTVLIINGVVAACVTFCPLTAFFFIDKWGRRKMFIGTAIGQACVMFIIATMVTQAPRESDGSYTQDVAIAVVPIFISFYVFYGPGWGACMWIWTSEIWPTVVRANGVAIASQSQQVAGIILGQAFPSFLEAAGFYTFYFFLGTNLFLASFTWFFIKETKGIPLERIDTLFGGVDHADAGHSSGLEKGDMAESEPQMVDHCEFNANSKSS